MTSLFAQLFLLIQAQVKAKVPEIRYIDQDLGQLEYYPENGRPAVAWPCLLLDFEGTSTSDHMDGVQWVEVAITARFGFSPYSSANSLAPDLTKEAALKYYEIENKLYVCLQGFDAGGCIQPLTRTAVITEKREDPLRVRAMTFTTATEDDSAANAHQILQAPLDIT